MEKNHGLDLLEMSSFLIAGHVVIDHVIDEVDQKTPRVALGGPISYCSLALSSLGHRCEVATKVGYDFPPEYERLIAGKTGIDLSGFKSDNHKTTSYKIDRTFNPRKMWLLSRCKSLSIEDFTKYLGDPVQKLRALILSTVANEISLPLLDRVSKEFELVLADSQGFVRKLNRDNSPISMKSGLDISSLSGVDVLKVDSLELSAWTGVADTESSIRLISKFVDVILLTSGPGAADIYQHGMHKLRARPFEVKAADTTGAGDIMLAAFAAKFSETQDLCESLAYSVSAATLSVIKAGVEKAILISEEVASFSKAVELSKFD